MEDLNVNKFHTGDAYMRKLLIACALIVSLILGALLGHYVNNQKATQAREHRRQILISFAIAKIEDLKDGYDENTMEALISNVYAALQFTDLDEELYSALHDLWSALIIESESISGKEDVLIKALRDLDPNLIKGIAYSISQGA